MSSLRNRDDSTYYIGLLLVSKITHVKHVLSDTEISERGMVQQHRGYSWQCDPI